MPTIKNLITNNKKALDHQHYIEAIHLSYLLVTKALKQICKEEKIVVHNNATKLNDYIKALKTHYNKAPLFKKKLKKTIYKQIVEFNTEYKRISKELKFQFPEIKLSHAAKKGMNVIILLNTTLIKIKANKL
jgi:hypothetical protein